MTKHDLQNVALSLVSEGTGILTADETGPTLTKRFDALGVPSTEQPRRTYREMLLTSPGAVNFVSGVIMHDETIRQMSSDGAPSADVRTLQGILPGIKVDTGAKPLAGFPHETVTEGLDGLRDRLSEYSAMGARFAKWRAVVYVTDELPSSACVSANAHALARYAALCQEQELVPIVEPEVLMEGKHTAGRREEVTGRMLHAVFNALHEQGIALEGMLLKPNMVVAGKACNQQPVVEEVATATLRCLKRHVPAAVPGIVFLSGGQSARLATAHLNAINQLPGRKPWKLSFSYGWALQDPALEAWQGRDENLALGQEASTSVPSSMVLPVLANTQLRWKRYLLQIRRTRRTAASGGTTDDDTTTSAQSQLDWHGSGGNDGEHTFRQGTNANGCVLAGRQLPLGRSDLSL
jgi:fructose-bisphosphate aldolase class I